MSDADMVFDRYDCGPIRFASDDYYDPHLLFEYAVPLGRRAPASGTKHYQGRSAIYSLSAGC
jgi:hypothetical protein